MADEPSREEIAAALVAAANALVAVPDPGLQELVLISRLRDMAWRVKRSAPPSRDGHPA